MEIVSNTILKKNAILAQKLIQYNIFNDRQMIKALSDCSSHTYLGDWLISYNLISQETLIHIENKELLHYSHKAQKKICEDNTSKFECFLLLL